MKILLAIVHYWDPKGNRRHQSLRPNPAPRCLALQNQLLALRRLGTQQYMLHMADRVICRTNDAYRHKIDIRVITDGEHTVLDRLEPGYDQFTHEVSTTPNSGLMLGFEAQRYLASQLDQGYDFYGYLEDDLVIHDLQFFQKLRWFQSLMGPEDVLLPQRVELSREPHWVDRFFIDGPLDTAELEKLSLRQSETVVLNAPGGEVALEVPQNPHAGCFFLSHDQLQHWVNQPHWMDQDTSFISPLESAATLGLAKTFRLWKPCFSYASWFELQHWGTSFHSLIPRPEDD
ncbi:calcium-binding protein [Synechococcus sp. PROS-U-1]|uniref:calcium-binding protein n=1 Tax=Synechococcus sp. PROS-U-1 TaxID=1400866 RepID=UPI001648B239|nr:calcium-binding protein [Synechococcus sp. PROS-U-1]QNJ01766.1 hypothetical protein SynPROSU1_00119 [Synechococcus sp. PROS-U-1]